MAYPVRNRNQLPKTGYGRSMFLLILAILLMVASTFSTGCFKKTVGRWDSTSAIQIRIVNWTINGEQLSVNITMRNNNFTKLPIRSRHFNVYDEEGDLHGCSLTNYSKSEKDIEIGYEETYAINLLFEEFNENNGTNKPEILEYKYTNYLKKTSFKEEGSDGFFSEGMGMPMMIGIGIILTTFLIIVFIRRKKKSFMG